MTDPFETLRAPVVPTDPDPTFAAQLRHRVERALALPKGAIAMSPATKTVTVTPYIAVADARAALDWYADVFAATVRGEPIVMPDGRIGHAELDISGALIYLSDQHPEIGVTAPEPGTGAAVTLHTEVADVDRLVDRAVAAGALLERPPDDNPYGRIGVIRDPFGHRWMLKSPVAAGEPLQHGDLAYVSLWVPDTELVADIFADVLGWDYGADATGQRRQVAGMRPAHGIFGGQERSTLFLCFAVDDLDDARRRVRDAGGETTDPRDEPYGRVADGTDDQGGRFALYQLTGGEPRPAPNGTRHGDLAYVTMYVGDSERARTFYGAVLGWRFSAGRVADGWQVDGPAPMVGLSGGHPSARAVPMYRVDDIRIALEEVRAAGGSAGDPQRQLYGLLAECTDPQGTEFYLGQL